MTESLPGAGRSALLRLARCALQQAAEGKSRSAVDPPDSSLPILHEKGAAFVTLTQSGVLRGCIGTLHADEPLWRTVWDAAWDAATHDPRFDPVTGDEWRNLSIEISVLTPLRPISGPDDFVAGRDGIVIEKSGRRAVFLPKVAAEMKWNREQTLAALCRKAGLPVDAWKSPGMKFSIFHTEVFGDL